MSVRIVSRRGTGIADTRSMPPAVDSLAGQLLECSESQGKCSWLQSDVYQQASRHEVVSDQQPHAPALLGQDSHANNATSRGVLGRIGQASRGVQG